MQKQDYINFSQEISTATELLTNISKQNAWDEKFRLLMMAGKKFPKNLAYIQVDDYLVRGCESKAWLSCSKIEDKLFFIADSESRIIKGLLTALLPQINKKRKNEILDFNAELLFKQLGLERHLSDSRKGGIHTLWKEILKLSKQA
jgi:sulfur transfer protein SufE